MRRSQIFYLSSCYLKFSFLKAVGKLGNVLSKSMLSCFTLTKKLFLEILQESLKRCSPVSHKKNTVSGAGNM